MTGLGRVPGEGWVRNAEEEEVGKARTWEVLRVIQMRFWLLFSCQRKPLEGFEQTSDTI